MEWPEGKLNPPISTRRRGDVGAGALDGEFERLVEQGRTDQVGRAKRAHAADPARAAAEGDDEDARDQRDRRDDERDRLHDGREPRGAHMLHHELDSRAVERHDLPGQHAIEQDDEHEQARGRDHDAAVLVEKRPHARAEPLRAGVPREALPPQRRPPFAVRLPWDLHRARVHQTCCAVSMAAFYPARPQTAGLRQTHSSSGRLTNVRTGAYYRTQVLETHVRKEAT